MQLYFAYGSNLNASDLERWLGECGYPPDCLTPVLPATLADHELSFGSYHSRSRGGGALDVRPRRGARVRGMLFRRTEAGWRPEEVRPADERAALSSRGTDLP